MFEGQKVINCISKIPKPPKNYTVKAYNMAIMDDDTAEINMYGDVYMESPRDWVTGERIAGQYIAADEFLEDLENVKDKSNITVHINSGGGDLYAGLAIYNRLKSLNGHVTTINDGLAASAASLIFQAGDTRKMNAGSNLMAHGVGGFLFDFYTVEDLEKLVAQFKAHNKAIVNVYAEAMGVSYNEAKNLIKSETWLTGQEAIDKGLADELIEEEEAEEENLFNVFLNKLRSTPAAAPQVVNKMPEKEEEKMANTAEELRAQYPELVAQIENAAKEKARAEERERIKGLEEIAGAITDKTLLYNAKFGENPLTVEEVSVAAMKQQAKIEATMLDKLKKDTEESGTEDVESNPKKTEEDDPDKNTEEEEEKEAENAVKFFNKYFRR
ncbi:MAG: head maturation protease, ClpP-related [Anaerovoracaceae bacterium]